MRTGGFKRLDLYIHDYMLRKKFLTAAEIFAKEANVAAGPIGMCIYPLFFFI